MKNDYKQITLEWLEKADSDLNFAKASLKNLTIFILKYAFYVTMRLRNILKLT